MGDCLSRPAQKEEQRKTQRQNVSVREMDFSDIRSNRNSANKPKTEDEMYQLLSEYFDTFDINKNNSLSFDEISKMLKQIQTNVNQRRKKGKIEIDMSEARTFFGRMDTNGDKVISKEEFYRFYKNK